MDTKGRKLFRYVAGIMAAAVLMGSAYATTAMASGIGLIDTADLLDVHAEASDSSDVVGQVMDEGHVAILGRAEGWVQIKAGEIIGWVPEANLIETEVSNEEAYEANRKVVAEFAEDVMEALEEGGDMVPDDAQPEEEEERAEAGEQEEQTEADGQDEQASEEDTEESPEQDLSEEDAGAQEQPSEEEQEADRNEELLDAQRLAEEQASLLAEAQKQAEEQAEAFAREQEKVVAQVQQLVNEQAAAAQKLAEEQEAAAEKAQKLAEEQAKAAALAQMQAQEQAKAAELAQKQAEQEAVSREALSAASVSEEDLELLASIIYCEAKGEPYVGKVAVANVVLNRVKSSQYPDTIRDVIYAKGQFSPVKNGSMAKALKNDSADASCYQAALEALAGSAPVGDKTSFRRVNGRSGQVIGHHVFY